MRASISSASGCENVSNVRTFDSAGARNVDALVIWKLPGVSPKNSRSTETCEASRQLCPGVHSGYGAVMSAVHDGSVVVPAFPSSNVVVMEFHGRQKSKLPSYPPRDSTVGSKTSGAATSAEACGSRLPVVVRRPWVPRSSRSSRTSPWAMASWSERFEGAEPARPTW
jgi:hypothetical protein